MRRPERRYHLRKKVLVGLAGLVVAVVVVVELALLIDIFVAVTVCRDAATPTTTTEPVQQLEVGAVECVAYLRGILVDAGADTGKEGELLRGPGSGYACVKVVWLDGADMVIVGLDEPMSDTLAVTATGAKAGGAMPKLRVSARHLVG
jgi:hypothetical protein